MSEPPQASTDNLQFASAEPAANIAPKVSAKTCALCQQPIVNTYFAVGDKLLCPQCSARINAAPTGWAVGRFLKASFLGLGAGLIGALIWFAVRRFAGIEAGVIAILVGFMVGKAVSVGSGGHGGFGYQILAVLLTYSCIAANYMPDVIEAVFASANEERAMATAKGNEATKPAENADGEKVAEVVELQPKQANVSAPGIGQAFVAVVILLVLAFALSLAAPFLAGAQNLIGILIIGFALWEAWKFNKRQQVPLSGPYELGGAAAT